MMKKFLLIVCGSFVGVWIALTIFFVTSIIMSFAMIGISAAQSSKNASVTEHSILHLDLKGEITDRATRSDMDMMAMLLGNNVNSEGLNTLLSAIKNAKENKNIDGIYIECEGVGASPATMHTLRAALKDFKSSGKFIYAYAYQAYNQGDYYIASVADSMFLNPVGAVDIHGLSSNVPYPKKLLDKLGVEMQVVRVGTFKSAVEPYMVEEMSDANRLQTEVYLGNIWKTMVDSMAVDRKITPEAFNALADGVTLTQAADSLVKCKLVDKLCYKNEMEDRLKALTKVEKDDDLNLVSPADIADDFSKDASGDKVAVLYAVGEIDGQQSPMSNEEGIDSEEIADAVRDLIDDDDVKALVLRVNSPGGSAFGSEQMWKALDDFKKSGKPFVVSMGDYAASGGYYISCNADRIFAEPTTITGSIGIFGVIPCVDELRGNKLGINICTVKTNENSDMGVRRMTPAQQAAMQNMVNQGYELFTKHCADGRHMTQDSIKVIAEGRVWDGITAKKIGLVDELGNLDAAIKWAATKAKLKDGEYETQYYPQAKSNWEKMLEDYMVSRYEARLQGEMGMLYEYHKYITRLLSRDHVLCIMEKPVIK
ncbi:MAG: signal peptide peptidase SppA [Bacteroidales bacterium]|nr:signal peptide peptidase SppA [Candidatus Sodaliphilus fimicaballi]